MLEIDMLIYGERVFIRKKKGSSEDIWLQSLLFDGEAGFLTYGSNGFLSISSASPEITRGSYLIKTDHKFLIDDLSLVSSDNKSFYMAEVIEEGFTENNKSLHKKGKLMKNPELYSETYKAEVIKQEVINYKISSVRVICSNEKLIEELKNNYTNMCAHKV